MSALLDFLVKPPGHAPYVGKFASNKDALEDAQKRFPSAYPASVIRLAFCRMDAVCLRLKAADRRFFVAAQPPASPAQIKQAKAALRLMTSRARDCREGAQ